MNRYQVLEKLGEGAQGIVSKARVLSAPPDWDIKTDGVVPKYVAIKKLKNQSASTAGLDIETIREILILRELKHDNIVNIFDIFTNSGMVYIIMPFMLNDLNKIIRNKNKLLKIEDIKMYLIMILGGVQYIHNKYILHRDLKPSNCLIDEHNNLKISDFGLSREYGSQSKLLSYQACTIHYRSPELLFGSQYYTYGLDIWSTGCVFAELLLRLPIFDGYNEIDQLSKIFTILGTPTSDINDINNINYWKDYQMFPKFRKFQNKDPYPLQNLFQASSKTAVDFFQKLCRFDPNKRLTAQQALEHPYFKEKPLPSIPYLPNNNNNNNVNGNNNINNNINGNNNNNKNTNK